MVNLLGFTDEEEKVISLYLEEKTAPIEKLRRINEKTQTLLSTNADLQDKLKEQEIICGELQGSAHQLELTVAEQNEQLQQYKSQEVDLKQQLQTVCQGQRSEELRMRNAVMMLEERLNTLTRENARLEEQKECEQANIDENANRLKELEQKLKYLLDRKAALEPDELSSIKSESKAPTELAADELPNVEDVPAPAPAPAPEEAPPVEAPHQEAPESAGYNPFPQAPGVASSADMLPKAPMNVAPPEQAPAGRRRPNRSSLRNSLTNGNMKA